MEELIEEIKVFNNVTGDSYDGKLRVWLKFAIKAIFNYLNNPRLTNEMIIEKFPEALMLMVSKAYGTALAAAASGDSTGTGIGTSTSVGKGSIKKIEQGERRIEYYQETSTTTNTTSTRNNQTVNSKDLDPFDIDNNAQLKKMLPMPFIQLRY